MSDDERSAALGLAEATRAVRMAEMRLAAFDVEHWGTVFRSKDRLRRELEADVARAHVAGLEAVHHAQRVSEAARTRAAEAEPPTVRPTAVRRRAGRPTGWTVALFGDRLAEAMARGQLPADASLRRIADCFETLDGTIGETTGDYLGKLARRFRPK